MDFDVGFAVACVRVAGTVKQVQDLLVVELSGVEAGAGQSGGCWSLAQRDRRELPSAIPLLQPGEPGGQAAPLACVCIHTRGHTRVLRRG